MIEEGSGPRITDARLAACAVLPPGPGVLVTLGGIDPAGLGEADRVTMVALYEQSEAAVAAAKQRVLAVIAAAAGNDPYEWVRDDLACALAVTPATAHARLRVARTLLGRARATWDLLAAGRLPFTHAGLLARTIADLPTEQAAEVQRRVLRTGEGETFGRFRRTLERAVLATDPRTAVERHRDAVRGRRAWIRSIGDGMAILGATLPSEHATTAWQALTAMAKDAKHHDEQQHDQTTHDGRDGDGPGDGRDGPDDDRDRTPGERRTLDQWRADVFTDLLCGRATGVTTTVTTNVEILVSADTLLGTSGDPGTLKGPGPLGPLGPLTPIDPATTRTLAFTPGATWTRLVVNHHGALLSHEPGYRSGDLTVLLTRPIAPPPGPVDRYRPTAAQERFVKARDRECVFPTCGRDADGCETDHTLPRAAGGHTDLQNLHPLCKRHHQAKTRGIWHLQADPDHPDRRLIWTSRHYRRYRTGPTDLHDP